MKTKLLLCLAAAGLALASAKSYTMSLFQPVVVGSTELKAGDYRVEVTDQKAVISNGKVRSESQVKVETNGTKYAATTVVLTEVSGKMHIHEIHLGGTPTKVVFNE
jgi:hypothetical protein